MITPTDTLHIDAAMLEAWRDNSAYDYNRELVQSEFSLREWLMEQIRDFFDNIFDSQAYSENETLIWTIASIVLLTIVGYFVSKYRTKLFGWRSESAKVDYKVTEDTIYGIDFDAAIGRAMESENYREALRLVYLQTLKRLTDDGCIDWQPYKTPTQYVGELPTKEFRELSHHFLRVRYGGFDADRNLVERMQHLQADIINQRSQSDERKGGEA